MKKVNYLLQRPVDRVRFRDEADPVVNKLHEVQAAIANNLPAVFQCVGAAHDYFLQCDDPNLHMHANRVERLVLLAPKFSAENVAEAFAQLDWDYASEKKEFERAGSNLDDVEVAYIDTAELFAKTTD